MIRDNSKSNITVFVKTAQGSEIASKLSGFFVVAGHEFRFSAIAFGRIGGHNASVTLSKATIAKLASLGFDPDDVQLIIQEKLVEGDIVLPDNLKPPS